MRKLLFVFGILIVLLVSSCNGPFYFDDNGKTVTLPKGVPFEINLEESVADELSWSLYSVDSAVVYPTLKPLTGKQDREKGTRLKTFYFQTVGTGQTTIKLVYSKEGSDVYSKEFKLTVKSES